MDLRPMIFVYADYVGAYAWIHTWARCAGCIADSEWWGFESPITDNLRAALSAWAVAFDRNPSPWNGEIANRAYDWAAFNRRGIALARRLKRELGSDVRVAYTAPHEDPNHERFGNLEVSDDGGLFRSAGATEAFKFGTPGVSAASVHSSSPTSGYSTTA